MAEDRQGQADGRRPAGFEPSEPQARAIARALFSEHLDLVALRRAARAMKADKAPANGPASGEPARDPGPRDGGGAG